ncbi:MAG: hypothetical protein GXY44_00040 [Phycisphaerales bacterium]|nr:hypothetical protein [Phycisphaerales bacterium]
MQTNRFAHLVDDGSFRMGFFRISRRAVPCMAMLPLLAALLGTGGCTGSGKVQVLPIARRDLPPGEPLIQKIPVHEAYYWVDDEGKLKIVLQYRASSLLGPVFDTNWALSMVLPGPPAGSERLYELRSADALWVFSQGGNHQRCRSLRGVVVVEGQQNDRLRGRFQITVHQQLFSMLGGWQNAAWLVTLGEFEAVQNATRGEEILAKTEMEDFDRSPPKPRIHPLSQPTDTQPAGLPQG